jgi:hypothetical protein
MGAMIGSLATAGRINAMRRQSVVFLGRRRRERECDEGGGIPYGCMRSMNITFGIISTAGHMCGLFFDTPFLRFNCDFQFADIFFVFLNFCYPFAS